jgi:hypothetical protein
MGRFTVIYRDFLAPSDVLPCIDFDPVSIDTKICVRIAAMVQMTEHISLRTVQREFVAHIHETDPVPSLRSVPRNPNGYEVSRDLTDLASTRDIRTCEHAGPFYPAPTRSYQIPDHDLPPWQREQ